MIGGRRALHVVWLLLALAPVAAAESPRRVLVLQSFGRGLEPFASLSSAFRTGLAETSPEPVEFHEIPVVTSLVGGAASEAAFVDYVVAIDAERPFALVVAFGGPAIRFMQRNRERLFPSTPLLIAGVDERHVARETLTANDAAVPVGIDLRAAFENIIRVLPETTNVVVVLGQSPLERFWAAEIRREIEPLAGPTRLTFLEDLPLREILPRVAALPSGTAILYGLYLVDAEGGSYEHDRALAALHSVAGAPIFGLFAHQLGSGVVGGPLISGENAGRATADAARRILQGAPPSGIRPRPIGPSAPEFDWRELERWGIDRGRLPAGSAIRFRPASFWVLYKWHALGIAALCSAQALLILVLLANRARRRQAEEGLRKSREQYALAVEGSNDGVWDWDLRTEEVYLSPRARELLGYAADETVGKIESLKNRVHAEDRRAVTAALRSHLDGRTPAFRVEYRMRPDGGTQRWILARGKAERDAEGRAYRMAGSLSEITERKLAEHAVRDLSRRLIVVQEEEHARLARELHDDVSQRLARLAIDAGRVERASADSPAGETMRDLRDGLVRLSEDVHALSYRLHPSLLEDLGLAEALQVECDRFSRQGSIPAELRVPELPAFVPPGVSICLYRIAQEALRNVERHARACRVELTLQALDGGLQLAVQDDGVGFDASLVRGRPSLGLASMRERVHLLGGEIDIESAPEQGTTIVAWVPLDGGRP